jgi:hypothetical protein
MREFSKLLFEDIEKNKFIENKKTKSNEKGI